MKRVSILEVSQHAGVSPATVSRVTNNIMPIKESTRLRVLKVMDDLGYQPNIAAQTLSSKRSNTLGMMVSGLDGPFYGPMMSGVEETLRKHNKHVIIASGYNHEAGEKDAIDFLISRQVDGLIILADSLSDDYLQNLAKQIPIYLINHHVEGIEDRNIWLDNKMGSYQATRHLIEQGHTQIVCISAQSYKQDANERVEGYQQAMLEAGLSTSPQHIARTRFEVLGGIQAMNQFKEAGIAFTGVVAGNDEAALGVYEWSKSHGYSIPNNISIVGFDDILVANYVHPPLTSVRYPKFEMAKACANMAFNELYHKKSPQGIKFATDLVKRNSVASLS